MLWRHICHFQKVQNPYHKLRLYFLMHSLDSRKRHQLFDCEHLQLLLILFRIGDGARAQKHPPQISLQMFLMREKIRRYLRDAPAFANAAVPADPLHLRRVLAADAVQPTPAARPLPVKIQGQTAIAIKRAAELAQ